MQEFILLIQTKQECGREAIFAMTTVQYVINCPKNSMETSKTMQLFCPVFLSVAEGSLKTHGQCFEVSIIT